MGANVVSFYAFDTLNFAANLENSGFTREQAVALAKAEAEILSNLLEEKLVTKTDLRQECQEVRTELQVVKSDLKQEIQDVRTELKQEIQDVRTELLAVKSDLKQEIQDVRTELKQEIQDVRTELKLEIQHSRTDFSMALYKQTRWLVTVMLSSVAFLGVLMGIFKFVH